MSIDTYLEDIELIKNEILKEKEKNNVQNTLSITTYNKMLEKVELLKKNAFTDFSLVFIGEKGVGKTTNICRFLNLVQNVSKKRKGKEIEVIEEILQTGSGATTICDIEIASSPTGRSFIEIEEISTQDVYDYLKSFAEYIFVRAQRSNDSTVELEDSVPLPPEIERACRNMTKLKETKENEIRIDHGIELAKRYDDNEFTLFLDAVFSRANINNRTQTNFTNDINITKEEEKVWIKTIFKDLNLGKIEVAPLPRVIKIYLSDEIFDFKNLPNINRIVDTRGLDASANSDRKDLYKIFREEANNIIILIDKFAAPSLSMIDLLNTYAFDEHLNLIDRLIYLVNFRNNEPNLVVGVDGTVDDEIEGIDIRRNQILRRFSENKIPFNENNIIFYNPLRFLDSEKRLEITFEDFEDYGSKEEAKRYKNEIIEDERKYILQQISDIISSVIDKYNNEVKNIKMNLEKLKYSHENDEYAKSQLSKVIQEVEGYHQENIEANEKVLKIYDNYFKSKYPSTIRAINNRHGVYGNHDIYQEGAIRIEDLVKYQLKEIKDHTMLKLISIKGYTNLSSGQEVALNLLIEDINILYENYINQINRSAYDTFENNVFSLKKYEPFWRKAIYRWGQGSGYKVDIINYYEEQMKASRLLDAIEITLDQYIKSFIENIIGLIREIE